MKKTHKMFALIIALAMILTCMQLPAAATSSDPVSSEPIESAFTDTAFLSAVREAVGKTNGEHIYPSDVEGIAELDVSNCRIENLDGIEFFTGLTNLQCWNNKIPALDLSQNPNLQVLDCSYNLKMDSIDLTNCPELTSLDCNYTAIQRLNVRNNSKLTRLVCFSCPLRTLNVSNNPLLEMLDTYDTRLTSLDISNNTKLEFLDCSCNNMSSTNCVMGWRNEETFTFEPQNEDIVVEEAFTDKKFLSAVREAIGKQEGEEIIPSELAGITELSVNNRGLTSLDGIEYMTALEKLDCTSNYLTSLDLYSNKHLKEVHCGDNSLTDLDVSGSTQLKTLEAYHNSLFSVDVSRCNNLEAVNVSDNNLRDMNLSASKNLKNLHCSGNKLSGISKLKLAENISSKLPPDVGSSGQPSISGDFLMEFEPQFSPVITVLDLSFSTTGTNKLLVSGLATPNAKIDIYDITDADFTDIPDEHIENEKYIESVRTAERVTIQKLIKNRIPLGQVVADADMTVDGQVELNTKRKQFKFFAVSTSSRRQTTARTWDVKSSFVFVESLKYNSNRGYGWYDIFNSSNPSIITYNYFGSPCTFSVGLANPENVENAYIHVQHSGYNASDDRNKDIPLTEVENGKFQAILNFRSGSTALSASIIIKVEYKTGTNMPTGLQTIYEKVLKIVFDPSGFIYEGVPSNRLSGVKTTLYYKDKNGKIVEWNALEYNQENPITTNKDGCYEWFVPSGLWQVKAEKEGYDDYYTDWMRVPPAQMDVNFGMTSNEAPIIANLHAYPNVVEVTFNKYVYAEDINEGTIAVYANGQQVSGVIGLVNAETDEWLGEYNTDTYGGTGNEYVSKIRFFPQTELALGTNVSVSLNENIRSYANIRVGKGYSRTSLVETRPSDMTVGSNSDVMGAGGNNTVYYGETSTLRISLLPLEATCGKTVILTNDNPCAISVPTEVLVDENGVAEIPITGLALGSSLITIELEGSSLASTFNVDVDIH